MKTNKRTLGYYEAALFYVVSVSFVAVALLSADIYKSSYSLILGAVVFLTLAKLFNFRIEIRDERFGVGIVIILLVALLFRFSPYLFAVGGQDPGLYISMSSHIERTGTAKVIDGLREHLDDAHKGIYDASNQLNSDVHQPGIHIRDIKKSEYVFPWYPLHPVWMAIFAQLFGSDNRVYSLVFFSLISIACFYLLALEISGGRRYPAYLTAFFLAVNPLHAFFSKFPTNEILALAFASSSLYYLLRYYNNAVAGRNGVIDLVLSAGLMGCLFFVRMNVYIYVVFLYVLSLLTVLFVSNAQIKKQLLAYFLAVLALFVVSNLYYFYSLPELFLGVWGIFVHTQKAAFLTTIAAALLIITMIVAGNINKIPSLQNIPELMRARKRSFLFLILIVFIGAAVYHVQAFRVLLDLRGFRFSSHIPLYWVILYLSPFGFFLFAAAVYHFRKKGSEHVLLLLLFILTSLIYYAVMLPRIINGKPYQYYHARFLLSEIIPFSLLLIALFLDGIKRYRGVRYTFIALISAFCLFFTGYQLMGKEEPDINFYKEITASVSGNDCLFMRTADAGAIIKTPLAYYSGLNMLVVSDLNELYREYIGTLKPKFNDFYFMSGEPIKDESLDYIKTVSFKYGCFANGFHALNFFPQDMPPRSFLTSGKSLIPTHYNEGERKYYLYRLRNLDRGAYFQFNKTGQLQLKDVAGSLVNFYPDGWTKGIGVIKNIEYEIKPDDRYLIVDTYGSSPFGDHFSKLQLKVSVNHKRLHFNRQDHHSYYFDLDKTVGKIQEIELASRTFVPRDLGINDDTRTLGIDVASIEIRKNNE